MKSKQVVGMTGRWLLASLILSTLYACAGMFGPRNVDIPLPRLQASLARKFPINQRLVELIDIRLSDPKLTLLADTNRVRVAVDASVAPIFTSRVWRGSFTLSGRLQLDPARHAVLLAEPTIEQIAIDDISPALLVQVARGADLLAGQFLRDVPLYTFSESDFRFGGSTFLPTKIVINTTGLVVTFEPAK